METIVQSFGPLWVYRSAVIGASRFRNEEACIPEALAASSDVMPAALIA
jgi:hypothetical protein